MKNTSSLTSTGPCNTVSCAAFADQERLSHAFFGRTGGVSDGIYASLNCGYGSNDSNQNVYRNRTIVAKTIGIESEEKLFTVYQTHSADVVNIDDNTQDTKEIKADALVTSRPNIALGVLTADCTPVLFHDSHAHIIGAAHAGWKGARDGILENTIAAMVGLGAQAHAITACIGPTIGQASYEVGPEFYQRFVDDHASHDQFFVPSPKTQGSYLFDLPAYITERLTKQNLKAIENTNKDTCALSEEYFSYRRSCLKQENDFGRNISAIALVS